MTAEYSPVDIQARQRALRKKWERTNLLKNLNEGTANIVAQLLENQAREAKNTLLREASQTGAIAGYNKIAFPLVRRVFGQLLATELVSVQPMNLPAGLLFFLDFKYDRFKSGGTNGGSVYGNYETGTSGPNNNQQLQGLGAQSASGGFFGFDGIGYSRRNFKLSTAAPIYSGVTQTSELFGGATVSGYNFTLTSSAATDLAALSQIRMATSGEVELGKEAGVQFRSLDAIDALTGNEFFADIDHNMTIVTGGQIQIFTKATPTRIDKSFIGNESLTAVVLVGPAKTSISVDNGTNNFGDFEATSAIPEINISISSVPVQAMTRKLKATWTPELAQDIAAYHAVDAEVELTTVLADIISTEVDREILSALLSGAAVKAAWSRWPGRYVQMGANGTVSSITAPTNVRSTNEGFTGTNIDWYQTLLETVNTVSNEIHKRNMRSGANWMVTSPDVATILESIAYFKPNASFDPAEAQFSMGIEKVGSLSNRYTVYKDPYFPPDKILVGYKGAGFLDSGFVYAPYVPLVFTPTIFEPNDFTPRKGAMTRYAHQMVRPEFYGVITVVDLGVIGAPASSPNA